MWILHKSYKAQYISTSCAASRREPEPPKTKSKQKEPGQSVPAPTVKSDALVPAPTVNGDTLGTYQSVNCSTADYDRAQGDYPITRLRHCHCSEREDDESNYVSWYLAITMAVEVSRNYLLQGDSEEVHLDDWSSYQYRPNFDVMALWKKRPHPHSPYMLSSCNVWL
jgi:hypothetical protein